MDRKVGVINNWGTRGFGIVRVGPESSLERYYLHVSKIRSGTATPLAGMTVYFEVSDKPVAEGLIASWNIQNVRGFGWICDAKRSREFSA